MSQKKHLVHKWKIIYWTMIQVYLCSFTTHVPHHPSHVLARQLLTQIQAPFMIAVRGSAFRSRPKSMCVDQGFNSYCIGVVLMCASVSALWQGRQREMEMKKKRQKQGPICQYIVHESLPIHSQSLGTRVRHNSLVAVFSLSRKSVIPKRSNNNGLVLDTLKENVKQ